MKDEERLFLRVQRMFPNCEKYKKCCTDDKEFWDKLEAKLKVIEQTKQPFRLKTLMKQQHRTPEDFYGW